MLKRTALASFVCSVLIAAMLMASVPVQADLSVGATPSKFTDVKVEKGKSTDITLKVFNENLTSAAHYTLYADEAYASWVEFEESEFDLAPDTTRDVKITISAPSDGDEHHRFYIYVLGSPPGSGGTPVSGGLKIPVELTLTNIVSGFVWDEEGNALAGAVVSLSNGVFTMTDGTGRFELEKIVTGSYILTVQKDGYKGVERNISVAGGEVNGLGTMSLQAVGITLFVNSGPGDNTLIIVSVVAIVAIVAATMLAVVLLIRTRYSNGKEK